MPGESFGCGQTQDATHHGSLTSALVKDREVEKRGPFEDPNPADSFTKVLRHYLFCKLAN